MPDQALPDIPVPSGWPKNVRSAVLHVVSLAHYGITCARGWAANSINARVRLAADNDRLKQDSQAVLMETLQAVAQAARGQGTVRRRGQVRQHRRSRAIQRSISSALPVRLPIAPHIGPPTARILPKQPPDETRWTHTAHPFTKARIGSAGAQRGRTGRRSVGARSPSRRRTTGWAIGWAATQGPGGPRPCLLPGRRFR